MIFFKSKRIKELESEIRSIKYDVERFRKKYYEIERDMLLIVRHLGCDFEDINTRRLAKKGGPEKG